MKKSILLKKYLRDCAAAAVLFAAFLVIFTVVAALYRQNMEAIFYTCVLCLLLLLGFSALDFIFYARRHQSRDLLCAQCIYTLENTPEPETLKDEDYLSIIKTMKTELDAVRTAADNERRESMDYFTTWVHQIKTPIAVLRMMLDEEDTDAHRAMLDEVFRIEQYVEMVLTYLRLGSESSDYVIENVPLDGVVRGCIRKYAPQFIRRHIRLSYEGTEETVLTDEKWLAFIIEQLLSNALKYTFEGMVTITVKDSVLMVTDTGIGIAAEDLPRIFEKGFTGYNGRADKKATGLGLYLSRTAAQRLGHRLTAASQIGKGSSFMLDMKSCSLQVE
jgi:Signal transduction histidine kinase